MSDTDTYKVLRYLNIPLGTGDHVVYAGETGLTQVLDSASVDLLDACRSFKTLEGHARGICAAIGLTETEIPIIREQLARLAGQGFLRSSLELLDLIRSGTRAAAPPRIAAVGVFASGAAESVERCLKSFAQNVRAHGRTVEFVVPGAGLPREALLVLKSKAGIAISHAGPEERRAYREALIRESGRPDVVDLALPENPLSDGDRNLFLLHTVGDLAFGLGSDMVCRPASAPGDGPLGFSASSAPIVHRHFPDLEAALRAAAPLDLDVLSAHEEFLGKSVRDGVRPWAERGALDLEGVDPGVFRCLRTGEGLVGITQSGLAGHCGEDSPAWLLLQDRESCERLIHSSSAYEVARAHPYVVASTLRPLLSSRVDEAHTAAGYDNRVLLPPFPAEGRVFSALLRQCFPRTFSARLPWVLTRDPLPSRPYAPDAFQAFFARNSTADLLVACIQSMDMGPAKPDGKERLRTLGRHLVELGSLETPDFEDILRRILWLRACSTLDQMDEQMSVLKGDASHWTEDLRRGREFLRKALATPEFIVPRDATPGEASRKRVADLGRLLEGWPDLIEAAKTLRSRGTRPARPL